MKRSRILLTIALFCIFAIAFGIVMVIHSQFEARKAIYREYDEHLQGKVRALDYLLNQKFENWQKDLSYLVESEECGKYEKALSDENTWEQYQKLMKESLPISSGIADDILLRKDGTILLTAQNRSAEDYQVREDSDGDNVLLCLDQENMYFGMSIPSCDGSLEYIVLIESKHFYEQAIGSFVIQGDETILYDEGSGILMFKRDEEVISRRIDSEHTAALNQYFDLFFVDNTDKQNQAEELNYTDEDGKTIPYHISAISDKNSINGIFTVAVVEDTGRIARQTYAMMGQSIGAVLLLIVGTAGLAFTMLYNRKNRTKMIQQMEELEEKNELTAKYLERQKELAHHQRLEIVGTLTAGIAHEFNNLLTPIMGYSIMLMERLSPNDEESCDNVQEIYDASLKAKSIVASLSNLTRTPKNEPLKTISPDRLVEKVRTLAGSACPNNIKTMLDLKTGDATIEGDETRLTQMLLNLILNACQAMEKDGGILSISTGVKEDSVWIKVADTGKGIPKELEQKIFEPFFTTKETGKGTGLGLAIVHNIVQDEGGTIEVENLPEGGCCFTVYLKRNDKLGDHYYSKAHIEPPYMTNELYDSEEDEEQ